MRILSFLSGIMCCIPAWGQQAMLRTEMPDGYSLYSIPLASVPEGSKYSGFSLGVNNNSGEFIIYGDLKDNKIILIERIPYDYDFYPKGSPVVRTLQDTVYICSTVPNTATEICGVFLFNNETLTYQLWRKTDPSQAQTDRGLALIAAGKPAEALAALDSVQKPDSYYNAEETGAQLLEAAYVTCSTLLARKKYKEATELYSKILSFRGLKFIQDATDAGSIETKIGKGLNGLTYSELSSCMGDYCLASYKAKNTAETEQLVYKLKLRFPQVPEVKLIEANLLYDADDKAGARELYKEYIALMKAQKRSKEIDPLATGRSEN